MLNKVKKIVSLVLSMTIISVIAAGCKTEKKSLGEDGKVHITVSNFPTNANPEAQESMQKLYDEFMEKNPDVVIEGDQYEYSVDTFLPLVNSGSLPTLYRCWFSEIDKIIDSGYASDITAAAKKYGYDSMFEDDVIKLLTKGGKIYGVPNKVYTLGLDMNVAMFKEAGLVDAEGLPIVPETWDELREAAIKIKEKTGKSGFVLPTTNNKGGWTFMTMAWSYGVEFEEVKDNKVYATFNSPEMVEVLEFIRDLKWKDKVMPDNALLSSSNVQELFATNQAAMAITANPASGLISTYNMSKDDIAHNVAPAGPKGKYALMGGEEWFIKPGATPEEIDACMRWLKFSGVTDEITPEYEENLKSSLQQSKEKGLIVLSRGFSYPLYKQDGERQKKLDEIYKDYENVNPKLFNVEDEEMIVRREPEYKAQELYKALDGVLQEILTNKDTDIPALLQRTQEDFQHNYFDNYTIQ